MLWIHHTKIVKATPDNLDDIIKNIIPHTEDSSLRKNLSNLRLLCCLQPCVDSDNIFCIEGRLSQAPLPTDVKYTIILPSRHHPLTQLLIIDTHAECAHGGIHYFLMLTCRQFWVIKELSV